MAVPGSGSQENLKTWIRGSHVRHFFYIFIFRKRFILNDIIYNYEIEG